MEDRSLYYECLQLETSPKKWDTKLGVTNKHDILSVYCYADVCIFAKTAALFNYIFILDKSIVLQCPCVINLTYSEFKFQPLIHLWPVYLIPWVKKPSGVGCSHGVESVSYNTEINILLLVLATPMGTQSMKKKLLSIFTERDKGKYKTVPLNVNNDNIACVICFLGEYALQLFQLNLRFNYFNQLLILNNVNIFCLFVSGVLVPLIETSPLPVKGCKFWPVLGTQCHLAVVVFYRATLTVSRGISLINGVYNVHHQGPVTSATITERVALELSLPVCH